MPDNYPKLCISHRPDCDLPGRLEEIRRAEDLRSWSEVVRWLAFEVWLPSKALSPGDPGCLEPKEPAR